MKYTISVTYTFEVEADCEEDAENIGYDYWIEHPQNPKETIYADTCDVIGIT